MFTQKTDDEVSKVANSQQKVAVLPGDPVDCQTCQDLAWFNAYVGVWVCEACGSSLEE